MIHTQYSGEYVLAYGKPKYVPITQTHAPKHRVAQPTAKKSVGVSLARLIEVYGAKSTIASSGSRLPINDRDRTFGLSNVVHLRSN